MTYFAKRKSCKTVKIGFAISKRHLTVFASFFCLNVKDAKGASSLLIILVTGAKQKLKVSFQKILKRKNQFNSRFSTAAHNRDKESQCLKIPEKSLIFAIHFKINRQTVIRFCAQNETFLA